MTTASSLKAELCPPATPNSQRSISLAQERLWLLEQLNPSQSFNNLTTTLRLRGLLHLPALTRSLNKVVCRHEVLRSTFQNTQGRPVLAIEPARPLSVPIEDLSLLSYAECSQRAFSLVEAEARQ